ncbi:Aste57867_931 [Aphanomyces stellatus]|uniref:Aste57867_931 protein n=1 Tax=Aphanomyces stellatus TaxID=120398 RepID=A0A485K4Y8_9STRA|nr:hypothetical protein As57867_000930 [Aphanomyces stellatus]VFT78154.1 Aste57867_931 [Aphanomyces stellatus]
MAAVDDLTTYCFASLRAEPQIQGAQGLDSANGGLCPAEVRLSIDQAAPTAGASIVVNWKVALTEPLNPASAAFKAIDPTSSVLATSLYLCPGTDQVVACANRTELLAITNSPFVPPSTSITYQKPVALPAGVSGSFILFAKASLPSNYTYVSGNTSRTVATTIDVVTYRHLQIDPAPTTHWTAIGLGIAGGVILIVIIAAIVMCHRRRQRQRTEQLIASYAGAYIVRSRGASSRLTSRTATRAQSQYSHNGASQYSSSVYMQHNPTPVSANDPSSFELKLTHHSQSEASDSPRVSAALSDSMPAQQTPNFLAFAMSPLVEDSEMPLSYTSSSLSFSDIGAPESFDDGNNGYLNYAISPLVDHDPSRHQAFASDVLSGAMEMVQEEDDHGYSSDEYSSSDGGPILEECAEV